MDSKYSVGDRTTISKEMTSSNDGKFKATALWRGLVEYVRRNVKQKARRLLFRLSLEPCFCFSGSDLCDTVLIYLLMDSGGFKTDDLTRPKAAKLCQMMLDQGEFEPLLRGGSTSSSSTSTSSVEARFDDSAGKYYRFSSNSSSSSNDTPLSLSNTVENCSNSRGESGSGRGGDTVRQHTKSLCKNEDTDALGSNGSNKKMGRRLLSTHVNVAGTYRPILQSSDNLPQLDSCRSSQDQSSYSPTNTTNSGVDSYRSSGGSKRDSTAVAVCTGLSNPGTDTSSLSVSDSTAASKSVDKLAKLTGEVIFSPTALTDLRREIALSQLSQMIHIPVLDDLISNTVCASDERGYDNSVFLNECGEQMVTADAWIQTAAEVLEYLPNGISQLPLEDYNDKTRTNHFKRSLYKLILKNYRARKASLYPAHHDSVQFGILQLLLSGDEADAVKALQLSALLLPCYVVTELAVLLQFLAYISRCTEPRLGACQSNADCVLSDFSGIFFMDCKLLDMDQKRLLLQLMIRNDVDIAKAPQSVQAAMELSLNNLKCGDNVAAAGSLYCNKLTEREFIQTGEENTKSAIISLIQSIIDDTTLQLKDKQKHIKNFHKHHPEIMKTYFKDIA